MNADSRRRLSLFQPEINDFSRLCGMICHSAYISIVPLTAILFERILIVQEWKATYSGATF